MNTSNNNTLISAKFKAVCDNSRVDENETEEEIIELYRTGEKTYKTNHKHNRCEVITDNIENIVLKYIQEGKFLLGTIHKIETYPDRQSFECVLQTDNAIKIKMNSSEVMPK